MILSWPGNESRGGLHKGLSLWVCAWLVVVEVVEVVEVVATWDTGRYFPTCMRSLSFRYREESPQSLPQMYSRTAWSLLCK